MSERIREHVRTPHWLVIKTRAYEHLQVKPPSTIRDAPVIYLASSEARNRAAYATSHASPISPSGPERPADESSLPLHRTRRHFPGECESSEYSSTREEHSLRGHP